MRRVIGIDEVGRGALAGPVTVAAVALPQKSEVNPPAGGQILKLRLGNKKLRLKDSKQLSPAQREAIFNFIKKRKIFYAVASVSPKVIDKINVSNAANLAATRALLKLVNSRSGLAAKVKIFLDGGLYLNKKMLLASGYNLNSKTIIRGDEKIPAVSLASIVAKVHRDRLMKRLNKKYPRYGFANNVGYGAKKHIKAIKKCGLSPIHRKSFKIKTGVLRRRKPR